LTTSVFISILYEQKAAMSILLNFLKDLFIGRKKDNSSTPFEFFPDMSNNPVTFPFMSVNPGVFDRVYIKPESFTKQDAVVKSVVDFFESSKINVQVSRLESSYLYTIIYLTLSKDKIFSSSNIPRLSSSLEIYMGINGCRITPDNVPNGIVVFIPKSNVSSLRMGNIFAEDDFTDFILDGYNNLTGVMSVLPLTLGYDAYGKPVILDLTKLPSLLIGGSSGSGKSNLIHTLMATLLTYVPKNMLEFYLVDTKLVELNKYQKLEQVKEFISVHEDISGMCHRLIDIMGKRYKTFNDSDVSDIEEYNRLYAGFPMPYIVVVLEEFGDLMQLSNNMVEALFIKILQQGRAAGIHVIAATQRPSADMINSTIKANMPCRIALKVSSTIDSKIIINSSGAEKLSNVGDMIIYESGNYTKAQSLYIDRKELMKIINLTKLIK